MWKNGEFQNEFVRIQITNGHIRYKGEWIMHVRELMWECKRMGIDPSCTQEEAQEVALKLVKEHVLKIYESI